jgi:hypothetical protein
MPRAIPIKVSIYKQMQIRATSGMISTHIQALELGLQIGVMKCCVVAGFSNVQNPMARERLQVKLPRRFQSKLPRRVSFKEEYVAETNCADCRNLST